MLPALAYTELPYIFTYSMEQFWQYLVITDLKATERSKNTHSSQNMSDLGKCRVGHHQELLRYSRWHLHPEVHHSAWRCSTKYLIKSFRLSVCGLPLTSVTLLIPKED